jgi:hypothetical protein
MNYRNTEMKLAALISYFNDNTINLNPVFQRGQVWNIDLRRKLIENIIKGRPIPAIFLYKDARGSRYLYNILDGKQRLESLLLFIGGSHPELKIEDLTKYFFPPEERTDAEFHIVLYGERVQFKDISDALLRDFREYVIPTIEITLDNDTEFSDIIGLFVDINQRGVKVSRFDIVKAMSARNLLLKSVFSLLALNQTRGEATFYRIKDNEFSYVLKRLAIVDKAVANRTRVDRMWERLLEISRFVQTNEHRKPVDILKSFISAQGETQPALTTGEQTRLRTVFRFLHHAYRDKRLGDTSLATNQTHFYTMATSLLSSDLLEDHSNGALTGKLVKFGNILDGSEAMPTGKSTANALKRYENLSKDRTTDTDRRKQRQALFVKITGAL